MANANTCDAVTVDWISSLSERDSLLKSENHFAFKRAIFERVHDEGSVKCQNEPFSDFAV